MSSIGECRDVNGNWSDDAKAHANANLIAAAPDLYAELEGAVEEMKIALEFAGGCDHSVGLCSCELIRRIEGSIAVLAKARGEQP
jgi:dienelactone hydrolase